MEAKKGPKLIVDVTLIAEGKVLLVKYRDMPDHQMGWFVPHEMLAFGQSPDVAAEKLLTSQIHLKDSNPKMSHMESFTGNDGSWHLPIHYGLFLEKIPHLVLSERILQAEWFPLETLPTRKEVAHHGWALDIVEEINASPKN